MAISRTIPTSQTPDVVTKTILIDGTEIPETIPVTQIQINKEVNKIPTARIRVADGDPSLEDFELSNEDYFIPGKELEIKVGYKSEETSLFKGIIISHSNKITNKNSELIVEAKDKAVKLTVGRKNRYYEDATDSDIEEDIIDSYGLEKDIESTSVKHKDVIQFNTTDWDFILSRMDITGKICLVEDGKVIIKKPELTDSPVLDLLYGATILEYNAEIDSRTQFNEVRSVSWDYSNQEIAEETGDEPAMNEIGNLSNSELADVIGLDNFLLIHSGKLSPEELKEWANAKMLKSRLAKVKGHVKFQGFPDIKPGDSISLNGVGERFNGSAFVAGVKHEYKSGDWITEVSFGFPQEWFTEIINPYNLSAQSGFIPSVQGLQIGIVTDLEDPANENRVKVKLPVVNNEDEGIWMRIAALDAGNNRGTFFHPEKNDEVIVGFIFNDVNNSVILGMLNSSSLPAPITPSNSNHEKGYVSRSGIKLIFNDDENSCLLQTPGGKKLNVSDKEGLVIIEDENGNIIKMDSNGISIESVTSLKLKATTDITLEAANILLSPSSQFSVSAADGSKISAGEGNAAMESASVKISSYGITKINGSIVKIN